MFSGFSHRGQRTAGLGLEGHVVNIIERHEMMVQSDCERQAGGIWMVRRGAASSVGIFWRVMHSYPNGASVTDPIINNQGVFADFHLHSDVILEMVTGDTGGESLELITHPFLNREFL